MNMAIIPSRYLIVLTESGNNYTICMEPVLYTSLATIQLKLAQSLCHFTNQLYVKRVYYMNAILHN
jgi:hypothetical protein